MIPGGGYPVEMIPSPVSLENADSRGNDREDEKSSHSPAGRRKEDNGQ